MSLSTKTAKELLDSANATYEDDLPPNSQTTIASSQGSQAPSSQPEKGVVVQMATEKATGVKRQMALTEMYGPTTKKAKTREGSDVTVTAGASRSSTSVSPPKSSARVVGGLTPFNAIPFNMDSFKQSLNEVRHH